MEQPSLGPVLTVAAPAGAGTPAPPPELLLVGHTALLLRPGQSSSRAQVRRCMGCEPACWANTAAAGEGTSGCEHVMLPCVHSLRVKEYRMFTASSAAPLDLPRNQRVGHCLPLMEQGQGNRSKGFRLKGGGPRWPGRSWGLLGCCSEPRKGRGLALRMTLGQPSGSCTPSYPPGLLRGMCWKRCPPSGKQIS